MNLIFCEVHNILVVVSGAEVVKVGVAVVLVLVVGNHLMKSKLENI